MAYHGRSDGGPLRGAAGRRSDHDDRTSAADRPLGHVGGDRASPGILTRPLAAVNAGQTGVGDAKGRSSRSVEDPLKQASERAGTSHLIRR